MPIDIGLEGRGIGMDWFKEIVSNKKKWLAGEVKAPIDLMAKLCSYDWGSNTRITELLAQEYHKVPYCHKLYVMNSDYRQIGGSISKNEIDFTADGFNHEGQSYSTGNLPFRGLMLTSAYTCLSSAPFITVIQAINHKDTLLGFIMADFNLRDLPVIDIPAVQYPSKQFKGDPSIRDTVFLQQRSKSKLDENIDTVMEDLSCLFCDHGVFHGVIHFSSSLCTLWSDDDPYNYQIHSIEEMMNPELYLLYSRREYSKKAIVEPAKILLILARFKELRKMDDTFYLRSASINIMNNMIGLTFSCDGSHYMTVDEFLEREAGYWGGDSIAYKQVSHF